jgi:hypothetical protein
MTDMADQIRRAIDAVEPVTIADITATARRRRRHRTWTLGAGSSLVAVIAVVVAIAVAQHSAATKVTVAPVSSLEGAATSAATKNDITVRVTLDAIRAASGTTIPGQVTVINHSAHTLISGTAPCLGTGFTVGLSKPHLPSTGEVTYFGCESFNRDGTGTNDTIAFPVGTTTEPLTVETTYAMPAGMQPLPAGSYQATLNVQGFTIPIPPPITVTLSPATGILGLPTPTPTVAHGPAGAPPNPTCSRRGSSLGTMSVCPGSAPVGGSVTISGTGCQHVNLVVFLGSRAYVGSGGGGNEIQVHPDASGDFTVRYTIPATYTSGGNVNNPLTVTPGNSYQFGSYPADGCSAPFTVTSR